MDGWTSLRMSSGFTQYKRNEDDSAWIIDEEANKSMAAHHTRKTELAWALRTRVLTEEEMGIVASYDYHLITNSGQSYNETEVRRQFNDMLLQQFRLRAAAAHAQKI